MSEQLNISFYYEKRIETFKSRNKKKATNYNSSEQNEIEPIPEIPVNAAAQKSAANAIEIAKKNLSNLNKCHLSLLFKYPNLHNHIYESVENGLADEKHRKEIVKSNSIATKAHHHPTWISVDSVSHTETHEHPDIHYFPLVYLIINPNESNNELRTGQLTIFVHCQWSLGTSLLTHIQDLESLTLDPQYDTALKTGREIQPVWDKCPGQSKYNPIERRMVTLSGKLASVVLPIDHFGKHLNSQGKVINLDLALKNFKYAGEALCDIWCHDLIFGKHVNAQYIEEFTNSFVNLQFEGTDKEKMEELE
ncbi:8458_t:CDS:2 [Gigaspora margarita]|uniref:8458_t:CDS:1 n=1 Tax=Gigaspora margarita TaxID=4874 RepID=A0ABN7UXW5_GIGMA|nr:8458_t:CDS:2 [Gigaspora margarita]